MKENKAHRMAERPKPRRRPQPSTRTPEAAPRGDPPQPDTASAMVVGIGASAGGLEALTELLRELPNYPDLAVVIVTHLDPTHDSAMSELLARASGMQVRQVHEGMTVTPNCVYVIPPNRVMTIRGGMLHLTQRDGSGTAPMPIDAFFRSLAADCGKNAVGVILSGSASDGTLGIAAIKNEGGITFAQEPRSAKYDSMPRSAINSGYVDFVLSPADIARELIRIRQHPYVADEETGPAEAEAERPQQMQQIFRLLRQIQRVDFSDYKTGTIRRRIHRRMALGHVEDLSDYVALLQRNRVELEALHSDLLINVTSFFRDPETFDALKEMVYPSIVDGREPSDTIRIWVPGCSTGEEAYSHAISIVEYVSKLRSEVAIQIFGTDLSEEAVRTARTGIYGENIAADMPPARLRRFFSRIDTGYQIAKSVRDMCVFATQNVFNDPPFSRMDLVSCRNVLIYMGPGLQRRVFPIFHYALKSTGFLMVGNTEGLVGMGADLFEAADRKHKIYRKKSVSSSVAFGHPRPLVGRQSPGPPHAHGEGDPTKTPIELQREADRLLLTKFVPAAVVVNEHLDVLQTRGRASRYLEIPTGRPTLNLLQLVKPGLLFEVQNAVAQARTSGSPVSKPHVQFEMNGSYNTVTVEVIPFQAPLQSLPSFIVVFDDVESTRATVPAKPVRVAVQSADAKGQQIARMKQELAATKEYLQSIIEALEASNEELQSANEEIQSGNEELQSTNEELQTSKEELESANEELNTVNDEMQHRNAELSQLNNDLVNLLTSVGVPIVMLEADLSIRRITPQSEDLLGISVADVGRPLRHLRLKIDVPDLERIMLDVMQELRPRELYVVDGRNQRYRLRITPYRTLENRIDGVVLAFVDMAEAAPAGLRAADNAPEPSPGP